jgi:hypothetical protein
MNDALKRAIELWRAADNDARAAEHLLTQAYSEIFAKKGTEISPELIDQVARMRAISNEALMGALGLMKSARTAPAFPKKPRSDK